MPSYSEHNYTLPIPKEKALPLLSKVGCDRLKVGNEVEIALVKQDLNKNRLKISNISGTLFIASHTTKVSQWSDVFNFDVENMTFN